MLQNQFQPTLSVVQTPAENQETGVKCRRVVPGSGSSRCQWAAVGIQGMQQLASSGHSQLGSGRGSSCYLGNWALEGVGFLSAEDTRGGSVWLFAVAHSVVGVAILIWEVEDVVTEKQTWNLSKKLQDPIFG